MSPAKKRNTGHSVFQRLLNHAKVRNSRHILTVKICRSLRHISNLFCERELRDVID